MKITTKILMTSAVCMVAVISSCKKKDKKPTCRIITATVTTGPTTTIYNLTYNSEKKITGVSYVSGSTNYQKAFNYSGNTIVATETANGTASGKDSITVNSKNRPANIRQYNAAGTSWTNFAFEYDGTGNLLKYTETSSSGGTPTVNTFTSSNGNITSLTSGSSTTNLEYFTDKKVQPGDYLEFSSIIEYACSVYPHKNLLKAISSGSTIQNFDYEMNTEGYISKTTVTSGTSTTTINYQYSCD